MRVTCPGGIRMLDYLHRQKISVRTPCGGHGSCGKCLIRVVEGELPPMSGDRIHLSEEQIREGWRLVCHAFPREDVTIEIE